VKKKMKKGETFSLQSQAVGLNWGSNENTEHTNAAQAAL
jgi:hypothetical protein